MAEDIHGIELWAQIFNEPDKLSDNLAMCYDKEEFQIQADINTLVNFWDD